MCNAYTRIFIFGCRAVAMLECQSVARPLPRSAPAVYLVAGVLAGIVQECAWLPQLPAICPALEQFADHRVGLHVADVAVQRQQKQARHRGLVAPNVPQRGVPVRRRLLEGRPLWYADSARGPTPLGSPPTCALLARGPTPLGCARTSGEGPTPLGGSRSSGRRLARDASRFG